MTQERSTHKNLITHFHFYLVKLLLKISYTSVFWVCHCNKIKINVDLTYKIYHCQKKCKNKMNIIFLCSSVIK